MAQKVVLKLESMTDDRAKQKAIEAAADIHGVDSIEAAMKDQKLTVVGEMDTVAVVKKLKKVAGMVEIVSVGPAAEERPPDQKEKKKKKEPIPKKKKEDKKGEEKGKKEKDDGELMESYPLSSHYSYRMHCY